MFNKVFNMFAVVLFSLQLFTAGAAFADNRTGDGTVGLVLAGFWGSILLINFLAYASREKRLESILTDSMKRMERIIANDHKELHRKDNANAKHSSETAKSTGKRSKATAGVAKKKVSRTKKGV